MGQVRQKRDSNQRYGQDEYKRIMAGCMICDFTAFSTVFQSYQDEGRVIMKGCVQ